MAMGRRGTNGVEGTPEFWVTCTDIAKSPGHPFYQKLNQLLEKYGFDRFCEEHCAPSYDDHRGRPSIPPGIYFRMLLLGYFESLSSERAIAWRCADSMSVREFLGYSLTQGTPDHSSLSRIRQRLPLEIYQEVFQRILKILQDEGLLKGETLGVDASTLEANAAMSTLVRKVDGKSYEAFLKELAENAGMENPRKEALAKMDRNRKDKGCSNKDWHNPNDLDARVTKMKDGTTHFAYKAEHAVDLDTGALTSAVIHPADQGDTETLWATLAEATENLATVKEQAGQAVNVVTECVTDKGYHSASTLVALEQTGIRSYVSEPDRGRRSWKAAGEQAEHKAEQKQAVYKNRRRIKGTRAKRLQRKRAELLERSFAHLLETGGLRRVWLRGLHNVWKRYLIHACAFNLSLVMRKLCHVGTPRALAALVRDLFQFLSRLRNAVSAILDVVGTFKTDFAPKKVHEALP